MSVCELYGGFMTFVPDVLDGSPNLELQDPVLLWIYLFFMNGLWVWIPAVLVWDSIAQITRACDVAKTEEPGRRELAKGSPGMPWFYLVAGEVITFSGAGPQGAQETTGLLDCWGCV